MLFDYVLGILGSRQRTLTQNQHRRDTLRPAQRASHRSRETCLAGSESSPCTAAQCSKSPRVPVAYYAICAEHKTKPASMSQGRVQSPGQREVTREQRASRAHGQRHLFERSIAICRSTNGSSDLLFLYVSSASTNPRRSDYSPLQAIS